MLTLFKGEMLFHPAAMDYSGNTCSNNCAYCFANIRSERRDFKISKLSNLCLGKANGKTLLDWFFYNGYPVCASNKSDPFAASNRDNTPAFIDLMNLVPNGIVFQTKGLHRSWKFSDLDAVAKKNVVVYITIDTINEDTCRRIEPGAPLPKERLELARYAKSRGWFVTIGINPCWKPWLPPDDFDKLLADLDAIGVDCVFVQPLHLTKVGFGYLTDDKKKRLGDDIKDAFSRRNGDFYYAFEQYVRVMRDKTLWARWKHRFTANEDPHPSEAFTRQRRALGKALPSWLDYNVYADGCALDGDPILRFDGYVKALTAENADLMEYENAEFNAYIASAKMMLWKQHAMCKTAKSFKDLLRCYWRFSSLWLSPARNQFMLPIKDASGKSVVDDFGDPIYYYSMRDEETRERRLRSVSIEYLEGKGVKVK